MTEIKFNAFSIGVYKNYQDLIEQLKDDNNYGFHPKNILVCIGENTTENIKAMKNLINKE